MATILLVEDDTAVAAVIQQHLIETGHRVVAARGTADALTTLGTRPYLDLMIVDLVMPEDEPDGLTFATKAKAVMPTTPIIFLTAYYGFVARSGPLPGVVIYKPIDLDVLTREISAELNR
jgi:CheY-like chemotaxis protein